MPKRMSRPVVAERASGRRVDRRPDARRLPRCGPSCLGTAERLHRGHVLFLVVLVTLAGAHFVREVVPRESSDTPTRNARRRLTNRAFSAPTSRARRARGRRFRARSNR